ncbi:MAG: SCO family protein [Geminicoccaceae bacterium]|jgi:protein SCO1/2|nr:SCO family protein [Geminicoccaceae bacterium]HRY26124.1 SCO family protein [Geminicoccaceae bacterium]
MQRYSARSPIGAVLLCLGLLGPAAADEAPNPFDERAALAYSQAAIGRSVSPHVFLDDAGQRVSLGDFRGRPLVLNLVFTACSTTCPVIVQSLHRSVQIANGALGPDAFSVVTIGFDTDRDTPEQMRAFRASQGVRMPNWSFLSADEATIEALSAEVGFIYFPSPRGFDHLTTTTILDAEGTVFRHVYGDAFEPPAVVEPLKDLVWGRFSPVADLEGAWNRIRLLCTLYDPKNDRYRFDYGIFIGLIAGIICLGGIAVVLARAWLATRRRPDPASALPARR